jgi:CRISPR system Cascade subunit CasE
MTLCRFLLNAASRDVQRCLFDSQTLHARVMDLFGPQSAAPRRTQLGVLYRLEVSEREGLVRLLVQADVVADPSCWPAGFLDPRAGADATAMTPLEPLLARVVEGETFRLRLRANPTRRIDTKSAPDGTRRHGRRVPLRGDEARAAWIIRKLEAAGFRPLDGAHLRQQSEGTAHGRRAAGHITHEAHVFDGGVVVADAERARRALRDGIGPAKAYGFGMLSLAPLGTGGD